MAWCTEERVVGGKVGPADKRVGEGARIRLLDDVGCNFYSSHVHCNDCTVIGTSVQNWILPRQRLNIAV